ncbi:hypothetical protein CHUAL_013390 [Chamberlinius hualienensis]
MNLRYIVAVFTAVVAIVLWFNIRFFDPESIRGKRVLVTGASSGIGEQIAFEYAKLGAKLVITARRSEHLTKVAKYCRQLGAMSVSIVSADITVPDGRAKLVAETLKILQGLDVLILNHGIMPFGLWKFSSQNFTSIENLMNVNFLSYVDLTTQFFDSLKHSKGRIGVLSSVSGKHSFPLMVGYAASKQALQGFFNGLRQEIEFQNFDVTVTLAIYGPIATLKAIETANKFAVSFDPSILMGKVENAAIGLVKGVALGNDEVYYPLYTRLVPYLSTLTPGLSSTAAIYWLRLLSNFIDLDA